MNKRSVEVFNELVVEEKLNILAKDLAMDSLRDGDGIFNISWKQFTYKGYEFEVSVCLKEEGLPLVTGDMFSMVVYPVVVGKTGNQCRNRLVADDPTLASVCHEVWYDLKVVFEVVSLSLGMTVPKDENVKRVEGYEYFISESDMTSIVEETTKLNDCSDSFIDLQLDNEFIDIVYKSK